MTFEETLNKYKNKKICDIKFSEGKDREETYLASCEIYFEDGTALKIIDDDRQCCESRYITTDDNVEDVKGGFLLDIILKYGQHIEKDGDTHEICFVEIQTTKGSIVLVTHNDHNGYYGGFSIVLEEMNDQQNI